MTTTELSRLRRTFLMVVCCGAVALVMATMTGLYPVAPDISRATGATQTEITWIVDAYTLAIAGLLLPAGAVSDRFGRRGLLILGLAVYAAASLMLALVDTPNELILGRVLLGVGAALFLPSTLSLITSVYPEDRRDWAVGVWTASFACGGGFGTFTSAGLLEFFDWRSSFWMFLVIALLFLVAAAFLPSTTDPNPPPVDVPGATSGAVSITALTYALIQGGIEGWSSPMIVGSIALGLAAAALFVVIQLRRRRPLLDVRVFAIRPFAASAFAILVAFGAVYGLYYLALQYQQYVLDVSALAAATPTATMAIGVFPMSMASGYLTRTLGLRAVTVIGLLGSASCYALLAVADENTPYVWMYLVFGLMGFVTGMNMAPCTSAILAHVPPEKQGIGAAVNHTTRELGTALGVALVGGVLSASYRDALYEQTAGLPEPARAAARESVAATQAIAEQSGPAGEPLARAADEGFVSAMHDVCWVLIAVIVVSALLVWFWQPSKKAMAAVPAAVDAMVRGVAGRVSRTDGTPLPGVGVTLTDLRGRQVALARTGDDGGYAVEAPVPGKHLLICSRIGFAPTVALVPLNGRPTRTDVVLEPLGHPLSGTVRTDAGTPVPGAELTVRDATGAVLATATTDADGRYHLDGLPAGTHTLVVTAQRSTTDHVLLRTGVVG